IGFCVPLTGWCDIPGWAIPGARSFEIEISEIVAKAVLKGQQMQASLGKSDCSHGSLVPGMHAAGLYRDFTFAGRLAIESELECGCITGIESNDVVRAGFQHVYGVVAPLPILGPTNVKLIGIRGERNRALMVEIGEVFRVGNAHGIIGSKVPMIWRGM